LVFVVLLISSLVYLLRKGQGLTFFFDEWDFVLSRTFSVTDLLRPHNGHLSIIPVFFYVVLKSTFGISAYVPYQILGLLVHGSVCLGVYLIGRRRSPVVAACAGIVIALLGSGWQNIMWPFQIGMMGSVSAGLWAIHEFSKPKPSSTKTSVLVAISLMCAGGGVAVFVTVFLFAVIRRNVSLIVRLTLVGSLYALWYLKYGESQSQAGNFGKTPQFVIDSALGAAGAIGAKGPVFARWYFLVLVLFVFSALIRKQTIFVSLAALMTIFVTWSLTGLSRAHLGEPNASRYLYVGAVLLVVATVTVVPPILIGRLSLVFCLFVPFLVLPNLNVLKAGTGGLQDVSIHLRSSLTGLEIIDGDLVPGQPVDGARAPQIAPLQYVAAAKKYGNAGFTVRELEALPEEIRIQADDSLFRLMANLHTEVPGAECNESQKITGSQIIVEPSGKTSFTSAAENEAVFRWFSDATSNSLRIQLRAGRLYSIKNHVLLGTKPLKIQFSDPAVSICR
jgi:hypothetical protein